MLLALVIALGCAASTRGPAAAQSPPAAAAQAPPAAAAQAPPAAAVESSRAVAEETDPLDRIAAPFETLADALERTGRDAAAAEVRQWVPMWRADSRVAYFSQLSMDIPSHALSEPKVRAAFLEARRTAARVARQAAVASAQRGDAEAALGLLWRALREDPEHRETRAMLGLAAGNTGRVTVRPGRGAPAALRWPDRSFLVAQSAHFRIYSTASRRETTELAEDLERYFEVWTQWFVEFWADAPALCQAIAAGRPIDLPTGMVDVVLFGDRESYARALGVDNPTAAEQSTGYYSPQAKLTLLFAGPAADPETRYHEITHQLLQELGGEVVAEPGADGGFWVVEGIATYMESVRFFDTYASVGGWESPRLQYARARWLIARDPLSLDSLTGEDRRAVQQRDDLAAWYTAVAAYVHLMADDARHRSRLMRYLRSVYRGRAAWDEIRSVPEGRTWSEMLCSFLALEQQSLSPLRPGTELRSLCLGRTAVDAEALQRLPSLPHLSWLDLAHLPVTDADVERITAGADALERVNLEGTGVSDGLAEWLGRQRRMRELDLSFTAVGDAALAAMRAARGLKVLWLTGCRITDASVPTLLSLRSLEAVDVQRTGISAAGLERLSTGLPSAALNPLQLITEPNNAEPKNAELP